MSLSVLRKLNFKIILLLFAIIIAVSFSFTYAVSAPTASGRIDSSVGAILRSSSSTESGVITVLSDNTKVKIHKEVFKTKKSTSRINKWYYVTADGLKGYVRADLVDNIKYGSVNGKVRKTVYYRKGAGTKMVKAGTLKKGQRIKVVLKANPVWTTMGTSRTWYKIKYNKKYYYVCSSKVKITGKSSSVKKPSGSVAEPAKNMSDKQFEAYMDSQGFPESYKPALRSLHKAHPNWGFRAYKTGISWNEALAKQTRGSTSLVSKVYPSSYRDGSKQYEKGWYKANSKVVAYYMDPRHFINETGIYMFEDLTYKPKYQTTQAVSAILSPTKLPAYGFSAKVFMSAGKSYNVSPVFLASRARQETGSGGDAVNGTKILGTKVYNPFNIGAFGGTNPLYKGLLYAYSQGWDTPAKAVKGGAKSLSNNYISKGQYTGYYQRFNVRNGVSKAGTHQYMTNIMAPYSEAKSTADSYKKYGITGESLVFEIPVYNSMPAQTKLP